MKKLVLLLGFLFWSPAVRAQLSPWGAGAATVTTLLLKSSQPVEAQSEEVYVKYATYQRQRFPLKRTPSLKLPGARKGGTEIKAIEQYLAGCFTAFKADTTALLLLPDQEQEFSRLRAYLEANYPIWNTTPYTDEINFYRQHDLLRRRLALLPR